MAAFAPKKIYKGQPGASEGALGAAVPGGKTWILKEVTVCNTNANPKKVSLSVVDSGGAGGAANRILDNKSIPGNDSIVLALSTVMGAGDFLSGLQETAGAITLVCSGVEQ